MKTINTASCTILTSLLLLSNANASCTDTPLSKSAIKTLVAGHTVCVTSPEKSQEFHSNDGPNGGVLIDWKRGSLDPIDPTETVGTWAISGGGVGSIAYTYGTNGPYSFQITVDGASNYWYCGTTNIQIDDIRNGQVQC